MSVSMTRWGFWWPVARWLKATFQPPKYYLATYGDMGLQVEFFRDRAAYDEAVQQAEEDHEYDRIDTWTDGELANEQF